MKGKLGQGALAYDDSAHHARDFPFGGEAHHVGEFSNYLEAMGDALLTGTEPRPNLEDGMQVAATLAAIRKSIETGGVTAASEVPQRAGVSLG